MAQVSYSPEAVRDLERLFGSDSGSARRALSRILECVALLRTSPELGRQVSPRLRELVISRGSTGHLALYRFDAKRDGVRVVRSRHQKEAGYPDAIG